MSEPTPSEKLLSEIRDDQRQHLTEYRQFIGEVRAQQTKARKGARVILWLFLLLAVVVILMLINGPGRCLLRRPPRYASVAEYPNGPPRESPPYRFTAEQLAEIRTIESRFKGIGTITAVIDALGEPDEVIDQDIEEYPTLTRRFLYHGQRTIEVEVQQTFGDFHLFLRPKPGRATTKPAPENSR